VPDPEPDPASLIEASQDERRLAHCLGTLEGGDAGLIRRAFFEGLTYADLAARASAPLGTVKSRIRRALLKLRECLS
jgi:RNA polymerase sigma-70 factor (ECF subfamily)